LHRVVVDHHQLLNIVRNRTAGIRGQLRRKRQTACRNHRGRHRTLHQKLEQVLPPAIKHVY
jgi:hypothetical protein